MTLLTVVGPVRGGFRPQTLLATRPLLFLFSCRSVRILGQVLASISAPKQVSEEPKGGGVASEEGDMGRCDS